jgi:hypothetical protein
MVSLDAGPAPPTCWRALPAARTARKSDIADPSRTLDPAGLIARANVIRFHDNTEPPAVFDVVIFATSVLASAFTPAFVCAAWWKKANTPGAIVSMLAGAATAGELGAREAGRDHETIGRMRTRG